jgi:hypothetical protein
MATPAGGVRRLETSAVPTRQFDDVVDELHADLLLADHWVAESVMLSSSARAGYRPISTVVAASPRRET